MGTKAVFSAIFFPLVFHPKEKPSGSPSEDMVKRKVIDMPVLFVTLLFFAVATFMYGLAPSTLVYFLMTAVEGIGGMSLPILRGVFSNCVPGEKQGAVFSAIGSLEAALSFLSPLIFQNIYTHTVSEMPAATFYVIGGILVAAAFSTLPLIRPIHAAIEVVRAEQQRLIDINGNPNVGSSATAASDVDSNTLPTAA